MNDMIDFNKMLTQMLAQGADDSMKIPPPIFAELKGEVLALDVEAGMMQTRYPVEERFTNPLGYVQGGIIGATLDNTIGPLSFLVAPPSVTVTFNLSFLKPIAAPATHYVVTAQFEGREGRKLTFSAVAHNEDRSIEYTKVEAVHLIVRRS